MIQKNSVLIVEDDRHFKNVLLDFFKALNEEMVVESSNGVHDSIRTLEYFVPDVVLLDLKLGKESGFDLLKFIRQSDRFKHTRVYVLTGDSDPANRSASLELGAEEVLVKPLSLQDLQSVAVKITGLRRNKWSERPTHKIPDPAYAHSIINHALPRHREFLVFAKIHPLEGFSGDFIDIRMEKNRLILILGDCTGHNEDSAKVALILKSISDRCVPLLRASRTDLYLRTLNRWFMQEKIPDQYPTLFAAVLDLSSRTLYYSNANSPLPLMFSRKEDCWKHLPSSKGFFLNFDAEQVYEQVKVPVQNEDRLFVYSDGFSDLLDSTSLPTAIETDFQPNLSNIKDLIESRIRGLRSAGAQRDDVSYILLQIIPHYMEKIEIRSVKDILRLLKSFPEEARFRGYSVAELRGFLWSLASVLRDVFETPLEDVSGVKFVEVEVNCRYLFFSVEAKRRFAWITRPFRTGPSRIKKLKNCSLRIGNKLHSLNLSSSGKVVTGIRYRQASK